MQVNLLERVVSDVTGKAASGIVKSLYDKKNVNEFLIAKKLQLTINQTRNLLYKLSDAGLVSFTRKKDKRKGWYTYFWTLDVEKSLLFLRESLRKEIEQLNNSLKNRESKRFYICKSCGIEVNEETALLNNFSCKECGVVYELASNEKVINDLKQKITRLNKDLDIINQEVSVIQKESAKKRERKDALEKKKKAQERAKKLAKRKKERAREEKKAKKAKKTSKKKRK
jgi:transcription factor E